MPRVSPDEKREILAKKKQQIEAQLKTLDTRAKSQARKDDTRRKVITGALALEHMTHNPHDPLTVKLREILAHSVDARSRKLFPFLAAMHGAKASDGETKGGNGPLAPGEFDRLARKELEPREGATATG